MDLAGRRVKDSMTMHFGYKATYESWPSKEYGCQTKYKDFFCCVERTRAPKLALPSWHWQALC